VNIVTPIPTSFAIPTANIPTEAARRDNLMREPIPATSGADQGEAEQALGSEKDKARTPGQAPAAVTYERPQHQSNQEGASATSADADLPDNGKDESAGKEAADEKSQQNSQQSEIDQLKQRDEEVRTHEQAHVSAGGQYASSPQYQYTQGPDGQRYVIDGEVSIDISTESTAAKTLRKMEQVRAAALAPTEPSPQDLQVANEAAKLAFEARQQLSEESLTAAAPQSEETNTGVPTLDEIVQSNQISTPTRRLDKLAATDDESDVGQVSPSQVRSLEIDAALMAKHQGVIQQFYQQVGAPDEGGFSTSA
jgi:hypothetical protein